MSHSKNKIQPINGLSWLSWLILVVGFGSFCEHVFILLDYTMDDAFISFRYAQNLVSGHGLVFNQGGDRAEGLTSPLYAVILAALSYSGLSFITIAKTIGITACLGTAFLLARLVFEINLSLDYTDRSQRWLRLVGQPIPFLKWRLADC